MEQRKKLSGLFRRYFIYYILILLIPILISGLGIGYFLYTYNEKQISDQNEKFVSSMKTTFDNTFYSIYAVNEMIIHDELLKNAFRDTTVRHYNLYECCNELENIKTVVPFLESIILLDVESPYILSSSGTYTLDLFQTIYEFDMDEVDKHLLLGNMGGRKLLFYCLDGLYGSGDVFNLYSIPYEYFDGLLNHSELVGSHILISDMDERVLYQYGNEDNQVDLTTIGDNRIVKLEDGWFISHNLSSSVTELTYWAMTPLAPIIQEVTSLLLICGICCLVIIVVGFGISYKLAQKMAMPIYDLSKLVKHEAEQMSSKEDEFGIIKSAFSNMNHRIETMQKQIAGTKNDMLYIMMMRILTGEIVSLADINVKLSQHGIVLLQKYFTIAIYDCDTTLERKKKMPAVLYKQLEQQQSVRHVFYLNSYDTKYVYVIVMNEDLDIGIEDDLLQIRDELFEYFACDIAIGYAGCNFYFNEICMHFYQSLLALDYKFILGKGAKLDYRLLQEENQMSAGLFDYQAYYRILLEGSSDDVMEYVSNYYRSIMEHGHISIQSVKASVFGIFNFIQETAPGLMANYQKEKGTSLVKYETAEDFLNYIYEISMYIWDNFQGTNAEDKFIQINQYIEANFYKDTFNIQEVADHFHMSMPTLSKYYKEVAGFNISEAVNELKMKKAMELLVETDFTINEIVLQIGYYNASSFIRKFKERTSITPGKYRELYKKQW